MLIWYSNPKVPGQKLKVKIPKKANMEKRTFVVSIPVPKVAEPKEVKDNNVPKEFKEALYSYSTAYDDWCVAEGESTLMNYVYILGNYLTDF